MPRDWRNAADYADLQTLDLSALAWEFLRRNPSYAEAYARFAAAPAPTGGRTPTWSFGLLVPLDPALEAAQAPLFWRAEVAPAHVVQLVPAPSGGLGLGDLAPVTTAEHAGEQDLHLRLREGLQVIVPRAPGPAAGLGALVALDRQYRVRLAAVGALARLLGARPPAPDPLSRLSRKRVVLMIRALDGQATGSSYRDIASGVLGAREAGAQAWRLSSARDVAIRLCRSARRLAFGGYRRFLALRR